MNLTLIKTNILSNNYLFKEKVYNYHRFLINELKRNNFIHTFKPADLNKNTYKTCFNSTI